MSTPGPMDPRRGVDPGVGLIYPGFITSNHSPEEGAQGGQAETLAALTHGSSRPPAHLLSKGGPHRLGGGGRC